MSAAGGGPSSESVLDNMAWHALTGPQSELAEPATVGRPAVRFQRSVAPFSAVERLNEVGWAALAALVGPGGYAIQFRGEVGEAPTGWSEGFRGVAVQYVADGLADPDPVLAETIVELGPDDAAEMMELVELTEPGPFSGETWRTGRYFGHRRDGLLVAMAGERLRVDGYGEVSAVCVHPSARGLGLGAALTLVAARAIIERGDTPMLHVRRTNHPAHALYLKLGFEVRREVVATAHRWHG